jgi:hypothetical protein
MAASARPTSSRSAIPVRLVGCDLDLHADRALPGVRIAGAARAVDRTGVEMEAMVAVGGGADGLRHGQGRERGVEIARVRSEKARRQVGCGSRRGRNLLPSTVI